MTQAVMKSGCRTRLARPGSCSRLPAGLVLSSPPVWWPLQRPAVGATAAYAPSPSSDSSRTTRVITDYPAVHHAVIVRRIVILPESERCMPSAELTSLQHERLSRFCKAFGARSRRIYSGATRVSPSQEVKQHAEEQLEDLRDMWRGLPLLLRHPSDHLCAQQGRGFCGHDDKGYRRVQRPSASSIRSSICMRICQSLPRSRPPRHTLPIPTRRRSNSRATDGRLIFFATRKLSSRAPTPFSSSPSTTWPSGASARRATSAAGQPLLSYMQIFSGERTRESLTPIWGSLRGRRHGHGWSTL